MPAWASRLAGFVGSRLRNQHILIGIGGCSIEIGVASWDSATYPGLRLLVLGTAHYGLAFPSDPRLWRRAEEAC